MSSSPDRLSPAAQAAINLVADYYRQQIAFENDRVHLAEILEWVRQSCSYLTFAGELAAATRQELLRLSSPPEPNEQHVAEALCKLAQEQTLQERGQADASADRSRVVLPDYEQLRRGDRVEVVSSNDSSSFGVFQHYTDPRIGDHRRQAAVVLDAANEFASFEPHQLRFAPDGESYAERYDHLRTWQQESFELRLYDTGRVDHHGKSFLAFEFFDRESSDGTTPLFHGEDFCCSPLHAIDSDATVAALLSFLSLRPGDTDAEYFAGYSPRQLAWRDERADVLSWLAHDLKQRAKWRRWHEAGRTADAIAEIARYGDAGVLLEVLELDLVAATALVAQLTRDASDQEDLQILLTQLAERLAGNQIDDRQ